MNLRPYQQKLIDDARRSIATGHRAPCLVLPTGGGKSFLASTIAQGAVARGGRVLWMAHRTELIEQAAVALKSCGMTVGAIAASSSLPPNPYAPVQVASTMTLRSRKSTFDPTMIIADECHHYSGNEFSAVIKRYPDALCIGLTATPERGDGRPLGDVFDDLVLGPSIQELTDLGVLVPCEVLRVARPLGQREIAQSPASAYQAYGNGEQAIVFSQHIKAAEEHVAEFKALGVQAEVVLGETDKAERREIMRDFKAGRIRVLVSVYVLTEGYDHPPTSVCIIARSMGHAGMYIQAVGRVLRASPGKTRALVLDLKGVSLKHGHPSEPREYSLEGVAIRRAQELVPGSLCLVCGTPISSGLACAGCGSVPLPLEAPKVTNDPLVKFAAMRRQTSDQKKKTYENLVAEGKAKSYKPGWASKKYHVMFGEWPRRS